MQYTLFIVLAPIAAVIVIGVLAYACYVNPTPYKTSLTWLLVATAGWLIFNTLELAHPTPEGTLFWAKVTYLFIPFAPVAWFGLALQFTEETRWLDPRRFFFLCLPALITIALAWTNDLHHLLWTDYHFTPVEGMLALGVDHGPWFWAQIGYAYLLTLAGSILILRKSYYSFSIYRWQSIWLGAGALVPIFFNVIYAFNLFPAFRKDYTPIGFALACLFISVGVLRYHLFDLRPVAREIVIDSLTDPMITLDMRGRVVDINKAALAMVGAPAEGVIGKPGREVFQIWEAHFGRFHGQFDLHNQVELKVHGKPCIFDLRISPLYDHHNNLTGRLIILHDITARLQTEADLRRYNLELEQSNQELNAFAHTVAHDLRTPLASLIMYSSLMKSLPVVMQRAELANFLAAMDKNGRRMNNIIDELLLLSRINHMESIPLQPLEMLDLVAEALDRLGFYAQERQAQIFSPEYFPTSIGYGPWVVEVWMNYISNALKYGGSPPRVELGADNRDGQRVRYWVRDHGSGIPLDKQKTLFTEFSRLDQVQVEGHGLGLSIVRRIVEKLGGQVGVESLPGHGSTFWFSLPAVQDAESPDQHPASDGEMNTQDIPGQTSHESVGL